MQLKAGMIQINKKSTGDFKCTLYGADPLVEDVFIFPAAMDAFSKTHVTNTRSSLIKLN